MSFDVSVITLFPELFPGPLGASLIGRAREAGIWSLQTVDLRSFGTGTHKQVDDTPYGGGAGMVLRADTIAAALDSLVVGDRRCVCLTPRGQRADQALVSSLSNTAGMILLCGRYEGIDQRVIEARGLGEISIGDFVLAGGEVAAMTLIEACVRLIPGVAGNPDSIADESFAPGNARLGKARLGGLEYPHYTRPRCWEGHAIPAVLASGDHGAIAQWREEQSIAVTAQRRSDVHTAHTSSTDVDDTDR